MSRLRRAWPLPVAGFVALAMALARYLAIPDWVAVLVLGGGYGVFRLVARMMSYPREGDKPTPIQDGLS